MDDEWSAIRVTSGSSIQSIVSSSLQHLSNPSSGPLILHTFPAASSSKTPSNSGAGTEQKQHKTSQAALGKLVSIVEIVKREFAPFQRGLRRAQAQAQVDSNGSKGKKRALEDDEAGKNNAELEQQSRDQKTILRVYQYTELTCFEKLGGLDQADADELLNNEDEHDNAAHRGDTSRASIRSEENESAEHLRARAQLDAAIQDHVIEKRKRPRKKHTPCMRITLMTVRDAAFEKYLASQNREFTLQYPPKPTRSRGKKRRGEKEKSAGEDGDGPHEPPHQPEVAGELPSLEDVEPAGAGMDTSLNTAGGNQLDSQKTQSSDMVPMATAPEPSTPSNAPDV